MAATRIIKKYPNRRLYDTEISSYITIEDVRQLIIDGEDFEVRDAKSGEDLTRSVLLQIIAEHESRGESVLPLDVLTDLVRSYTTNAQSVVPQFLAASFEMLREGQSKMMENLSTFPNPMSSMPGFEALQRQQQAFLRAMYSGWPGSSGPEMDEDESGAARPDTGAKSEPEDMTEIRRQLAELQKRISKL